MALHFAAKAKVNAGKGLQRATAGTEGKSDKVVLGRMGALERLARLLSAVRFGSDAFVAQVDAQGDEGTARALVCGRKEGQVTGLMASLVAESLGTTGTLPGVRHIEEVFELEQFSPTLEKEGYAVTWARKPARAE